MNAATATGTFESERAVRSAAMVAPFVAPVALVLVLSIVGLSIVGLLIGLLLITAGCGPPN